MKLGFLRQNFENIQISNIMKIRPVGAELLHVEGWTDERMDRQTDRHTDMAKLVAVFFNFANAPKNCFLEMN